MKIFSDQYPPLTEFNRATPPPEKNFFNGNLPSPSNFAEKRGFICQGVQLVEYSSIQILAYIGVTKKKLSTFCLHKRASRKKMRPKPLEISNLKIFSDQYPPLTEFNRATPPPEKNFFNGNLPSPSNFAEKRGFICQGVQLVEYSSIQILAYIGVTKKKLSTFCLHKRASRKKMRPKSIIQA